MQQECLVLGQTIKILAISPLHTYIAFKHRSKLLQTERLQNTIYRTNR